MGFGFLIIRAVVGLTLAAHGTQKLFGMFGGHGLAATGQFLESLGFRPGRLMARMAGFGETAGGLGLALGLLTPLSSALVIATMAVAIGSVHLARGFFSHNGGYEYPLVLAAVALSLAFTGPGPLSFDAMLGLRLRGADWGFIAWGLGLVGALIPFASRGLASRGTTPQQQ